MNEDKKVPHDNEHPHKEEEFLSDTQKIIRRHLENKDDVITEEDIKNVRVGMIPPGSVSQDPNEDVENKVNEIVDGETKEDDAEPNDDPITPWDTTT